MELSACRETTTLNEASLAYLIRYKGLLKPVNANTEEEVMLPISILVAVASTFIQTICFPCIGTFVNGAATQGKTGMKLL